MDMDIKGSKRNKSPGNDDIPNDIKNLPGFRGSSELPEHVEITEDDLANAFSENDTIIVDPTDLTLDRERISSEENDTINSTNKSLKVRKKSSKKQIIFLLVLLLLVVLGALAMIFLPAILNKEDAPTVQNTETSVTEKEIKPTTAPSPLTGVDVSLELAARPVTAIMIENSTDARPQSGLLEAEMIFEAIAEGGITRFVALFQTTLPEKIGPIRSARPYYVDIAKTFDAAYVHAGGSPDSLVRISELGIKDMSAFEQDTYYRADDRDAPHDLYSSMARIDIRRTQLGYTTSTFTPWKRKNDTPQTPSASTIDFAISGSLYNPTFSYDVATNSYLRFQAGEAHTDQTTGKQLAPKVVVALITNRAQEGIYSNYRLTGSGDIRVFQDGIISEGTWTKDSVSSQFVFKDKNGLEFAFNKGQTWISLIDSATDINYAP